MEINFVAMRIKDVSSVADDIVLHSQKVLNEGQNHITSLNLHGNDLESTFGLPAIPWLINLTQINLSSNRISSVNLPELSLLPSLTALDLSGNRIKSLLDLPFMPNLQWISLAHNSITSISGIEESVANLQYLDLRDNNLTELEDNWRLSWNTAMESFRALSKLEDVMLFGESLDPKTDRFRQAEICRQLFRCCANLRTIDGSPSSSFISSPFTDPQSTMSSPRGTRHDDKLTLAALGVQTPLFDRVATDYFIPRFFSELKQQYDRFSESIPLDRPSFLKTGDAEDQEEKLTAEDSKTDRKEMESVVEAVNLAETNSPVTVHSNDASFSATAAAAADTDTDAAAAPSTSHFTTTTSTTNNNISPSSVPFSPNPSSALPPSPPSLLDVETVPRDLLIRTSQSAAVKHFALCFAKLTSRRAFETATIKLCFALWKLDREVQIQLQSVRQSFISSGEQLRSEMEDLKKKQADTEKLFAKRLLQEKQKFEAANRRNVQQEAVALSLHKRLDSLHSQLKAAEEIAASRANLNEQIAASEQELRRLLSVAAETDVNLTARIRDCDQERRNQDTKIEQLSGELLYCKHVLADKEIKLLSLSANLQESRDRMASLEKSIAEQRSAFELRCDHMARENESLSSTIAASGEEIRGLKALLTSLQENELLLSAQRDKLSGRVIKLKAALQEAAAQNRQLSAQSQVLVEQAEKDRETIRELGQAVHLLKKAISDRRRDEKPSPCQSCVRNRKEVEHLQEVNDKLVKDLDKLSFQCEEIINEKSDEIFSLERRTADLEALLSGLETTLKVKEQLLSDKALDSSELKQKLAALQDQLIAQQQAAAELSRHADQLEEKLRQKADNEARLCFLLSEFKTDSDLAADCDDILGQVDICSSVDLSGCFQDIQKRIALWKDTNYHQDKASSERPAGEYYGGCRKRKCRSRIAQLHHELSRQREESDKRLEAKEEEVRRIETSLRSLEDKSLQLAKDFQKEKEVLEESLARVTEDATKLAIVYKKGLKELDERKEELRKVKEAFGALQAVFATFQLPGAK